jgi:hypothetical protein
MITTLRAVALIAAVMVTTGLADTARAAVCDRSLAVELTPDVPNPRDSGFLSSLLSNQVDYRLVFRGKADDTNIIVELIGPGPAYRCQEAIDTLSRDARVMSVRVTH